MTRLGPLVLPWSGAGGSEAVRQAGSEGAHGGAGGCALCRAAAAAAPVSPQTSHRSLLRPAARHLLPPALTATPLTPTREADVCGQLGGAAGPAPAGAPLHPRLQGGLPTLLPARGCVGCCRVARPVQQRRWSPASGLRLGATPAVAQHPPLAARRRPRRGGGAEQAAGADTRPDGTLREHPALVRGPHAAAARCAAARHSRCARMPLRRRSGTPPPPRCLYLCPYLRPPPTPGPTHDMTLCSANLP